MKKLLAMVLCVIMVLGFAGCKKKPERLLYNIDLTEYVKLGKYKGIKIDKSSDEFSKWCTNLILNDILSNGFQSDEKVKKGTVKVGDIAYLDFVGKYEGEELEELTAKNYDVVIGSNELITGFEEGLVGKEIGSTVKLGLTFPKNYGGMLSGEDVEITVKIKSVKPAKTPDEYYKVLGFSSVEKYYADVEERAIEELILKKVAENCKVKNYPQEELEILYNLEYEAFSKNLEIDGLTVADYLNAMGQTEKQLRDNLISESVKPRMQMEMIWYAIFDKEEMEITDDDKEMKIKELIIENGDTSLKRADIIEMYGEHGIESQTISDKVTELIRKNAVVY